MGFQVPRLNHSAKLTGSVFWGLVRPFQVSRFIEVIAVIEGRQISSSGHHVLNELLIINGTVTVLICLINHLIDLLICQFLTELAHDSGELIAIDQTVAIAIKELEPFM